MIIISNYVCVIVSRTPADASLQAISYRKTHLYKYMHKYTEYVNSPPSNTLVHMDTHTHIFQSSHYFIPTLLVFSSKCHSDPDWLKRGTAAPKF